MQKQLRIVNVSYSPGTPTVSIDVQPELLDDDGSVIPLGLRETVTVSQSELGKNWTDSHIAKAVEAAEVEVAPAVEADPEKKIKATPAKMAKRFADVTIVSP